MLWNQPPIGHGPAMCEYLTPTHIQIYVSVRSLYQGENKQHYFCNNEM